MMDKREPLYADCAHYSINAWENNLPQIAELVWKHHSDYLDQEEKAMV